jgi:hypothetical protein
MAEQAPNDEFTQAFGEPLKRVLDMNTWRAGTDLAVLYDSMREVVAKSVEQERRVADPIRNLLFPRLRAGTDSYAPTSAGVYQLLPEQIADVHCGLLFNGATECCDGTMAFHDSLLLSVVQIGLALVAYQGGQNTWVQRLYRRDLHEHLADPMKEAMALLDRRSKRATGAEEEEAPRDNLSRLMRRALMEYAERAALAYLSTSLWRMGHGSPVPVNLLVPTAPDLVRASHEAMRKLILDHRRFVYVVSEPADRLLLTIGNALHPLEFAIVETLSRQFDRLRLNESHPGRNDRKEVGAFMDEVGPQVVIGVYRAAAHAPARMFYAHRDFACEAAALAIADSALQPFRGFPMLIDLADIVAGNTFDQASFHGSLQDAYAAAGDPTRYLGERETRS